VLYLLLITKNTSLKSPNLKTVQLNKIKENATLFIGQKAATVNRKKKALLNHRHVIFPIQLNY
jgi:hypothetical protein